MADGQSLAQRASSELRPREQERLPADKGALGQVFTPPALVEFILDHAGFTADAGITRKPLLEPACGRGAFLLAAARRLADAVDASSGRLSRLARGRLLVSVLAQNLWGVDIDAAAVRATRSALREFVQKRTGLPQPQSLFEKNIVASDFLLGEAPLELAPVADRSLAFVIGNPPYVPTTDLTLEHKNRLRERFVTATGRIDLYSLFIEKAISLLGTKGLLSFIVPDKFLHSQTARTLRAHILRSGILRSIASFESHRVFEDVATIPCIFVFQRSMTSKGSFRALDCHYHNGSEPAHVAVSRDDLLPDSRLESGGWRTRSDELEAVAQTIASNHPKLGDVATRISAGLATGRDSVYVVRAEQAQDLDSELLRPAVRGRDISPLKIADSGLFILLPFRFARNAGCLADIRDFPRTYRYLKSFRKDLEARHCVQTWGKAWYDLHDPVREDPTPLKKILVPDIAAAPRFAFDDGHKCPLHSAYYIVPKEADCRLLAAILNSKPIEFLIRMRAPVVKDGFNRYRRQFLIDLPIPAIAGETREKIIRATDNKDFHALDAMTAGLFRLSDDQSSTIDRHLGQLRYRRPTKERSS